MKQRNTLPRLGLGIIAATTAVTLLAGCGAPSDQETGALRDLRASLTDLSSALTWTVDGATTYRAVAPTAADALAKADAAVDAKATARAQSVREALDRLAVESRTLEQQITAPGWKAGAIDADMYLKANVAEWRFAVDLLAEHLTDAETLRTPTPAPAQATEVRATTAPGTEFQDADGAPTMVVIPTGSYTAGSTPEEHEKFGVPENRRDFELPQRIVNITEPFAMGRTEVTVGQFTEFVEQSGYQPRGGSRWWNPAHDPATATMDFDPELSYRNPGFPQTDESPVVAVTRQDARAYAAWLSEKTGHTYRLPSEDEWEWAARGGATTTFFWGDDIERVGEFANSFDESSKATNKFRWDATPAQDDGHPYLAPVAQFKPNGYGLFDVTGNAREFTADDWIRNLPTTPSSGATRDADAAFPVLRGGGWNYQSQNLRLDYRSAYLSSEVSTNMFGFRLLREL